MVILRSYLIVLISVLAIPCSIQCQNINDYEQIPVNLKLSYSSTLIYPGLRIGAECPIAIKHLTVSNRKGATTITDKERIVSVNLSWYHHPGFHDNFYITAGWIMRRIGSKGLVLEFSPEIGLSRTYLGGPAYIVDENDHVSIDKWAGYYYALLSIGGGVGFDISKLKMAPLLPFFRFNLLSMFPYNSTVYLQPAVEIGVICKTGKFFRNVRSRKVIK